MKKILFFTFILGFLNSYSQTYEVGKVIDSIKIKEAQNETYTLYLPTTYDAKDLSAAIFIFDPAARGRVGVEVFRESAERFNYVLVCSNNSKNGPYQVNFDIANRLLADVFLKFNIDQKRIYTAGFSGGSRLATSIASLTNAIQGVIACGAGLPVIQNQRPHLESKFSYVGLVGDEDMNFQEMHSAKTFLNSLNIDNEILTYEDGHRWPSKFQIKRAMGWLELQAFKHRLKPINHDAVKQLYEASYALADSLKIKQPYNAVVEFERIKKNFNSYFQLDSISRLIQTIESSKMYKQESAIKKRIEQKEYRLTDPFLMKFREESVLGRSTDDFSWWKNELKKLHKEESTHQDFFSLKMMKRIRYRLMAMAIENSNAFIASKQFNHALYCDNLLVLMYPDRPYWSFRLAQSYARLDNFSSSLYHLKKAVQKGFKDVQNIKTSKSFEKFKSKKKFQKFLESLD